MPNTGVNKLRTSENVHITSYHVGTEPEQGNLYSPEQTSLHESEGLFYISICLIGINWVFFSNLNHFSNSCMITSFSLCFMTAGSMGNSRSSTQMNSYSDSGYQEVSSFHNSQNLNKGENRQQNSFIGVNNNHLVRSSRAEGQALVQVQ